MLQRSASNIVIVLLTVAAVVSTFYSILFIIFTSPMRLKAR